MMRTAPPALFTQAVIAPVVVDGMEAMAAPPPIAIAADNAPAAKTATPRRRDASFPTFMTAPRSRTTEPTFGNMESRQGCVDTGADPDGAASATHPPRVGDDRRVGDSGGSDPVTPPVRAGSARLTETSPRPPPGLELQLVAADHARRRR